MAPRKKKDLEVPGDVMPEVKPLAETATPEELAAVTEFAAAVMSPPIIENEFAVGNLFNGQLITAVDGNYVCLADYGWHKFKG